MPDSDHDRIVRLEEQIRAADSALELRTAEITRRLEILNHAHELARERDTEFVPRELYQSEHSLLIAAVSDNREKLGSLIAAGAGSSRTVSVFIAVAALVMSSGAALATIVYFATH